MGKVIIVYQMPYVWEKLMVLKLEIIEKTEEFMGNVALKKLIWYNYSI